MFVCPINTNYKGFFKNKNINNLFMGIWKYNTNEFIHKDKKIEITQKSAKITKVEGWSHLQE